MDQGLLDFVSNLAWNVTTKELFVPFGEADMAFGVFIPSDQQKRIDERFTFVRYRSEWDANRAMEKLNGSLTGDRKIMIQMAQNNYG